MTRQASPKPRLLIIGGTNLLQRGNHRIHHLVAHLRRWGYALDLVGHVNYREVRTQPASEPVRGPRAGAAGPMLSVEAQGDDRLLVVRKPPAVAGRLAQDLLSYALLRRRLSRYPVCVYGHPGNSVLAYLLQRAAVALRVVYDDWDYFPVHSTTVRGRMDARELAWRERLSVRQADAVVSVSSVLARLRESQGAKRVLVAANGVDGEFFGRAESGRTASHPPTLIFVGSLFRAWGVDLAIESLPLIHRSLPTVRFLVVGSGPEEAALRALARRSPSLGEAVEFQGRQDYIRLPDHLAHADVGVVTYRDEEFVRYSSSLKALEYMAAGLPVLGTRVGETARLVEESGAGLLVDFSPEAFAAAALRLFQDRRIYDGCRKSARQCAAEHSWERTLEPVRELVGRFAAETS